MPKASDIVFRFLVTDCRFSIKIRTELLYKVAQKASHYQMIKKLYLILLKPVNEIRFIQI